MDDSAATLRYEVYVPDANYALLAEKYPAPKGETTTWSGTAHDLGRLVLQRWRESLPEDFRDLASYVYVSGDDGRSAKVADATPAHGPVLALECAIEEVQAAEYARVMKREKLAKAMQDAKEFGGLSEDEIRFRALQATLAPDEVDRILEGKKL
ncbi:hypothetical protein ACIBAI_05920 [Streptomyces sp. NPDC051041]|uniref:hypothetical protein n=1 Tax=Streptomyces sp. NPDC051041 TaxID=3365640 RepID=UPI00379395D4